MPRSKREFRGGQYGNTRGKPNKQVARRQSREETGRYQEAMGAVSSAQDALERRIAYERANPTVGRVSGAEWAIRQTELAREAKAAARPVKAKVVLPAPDAQGEDWTMGQARSMLRHGYHIHRVQQVTGWGAKAFDDMKVDPDGYGLPII